MSLSLSSGEAGGRRSLDAEINMVPMIDLLVCCITFLVLTAVWSTMSRLPANAVAPGDSTCGGCTDDTRETLHVEMRADAPFKLVWKQGNAVIRSVDVPRDARAVGEGRNAGVAYDALREAMKVETRGRDKGVAAVLHADNAQPFRELAGAMDAMLAPKMNVGAREVPLVAVTLAR